MRDYPIDAHLLDPHSMKMARRGLLQLRQVNEEPRDNRCLCGPRFVGGKWIDHVCKHHKEPA